MNGKRSHWCPKEASNPPLNGGGDWFKDVIKMRELGIIRLELEKIIKLILLKII
jgi:hypothetical protein